MPAIMVHPTAWLVDLDGTLYRPFPVKLAMGAELLLFGPRALPIIRRFRREHERLRQNLGHDVDSPFDMQVDRTAEALALRRDQVLAVVDTWMVQRPSRWIARFPRTKLIADIRAFRARGGRLALVSDYPARTKLGALGLADLFDVVVANGEPDGPRRLKPHPQGMLLAASRLGVEPGQCLVVGDRDDADGAAARAAGMAFRRIR